jgi:hypothetical protein
MLYILIGCCELQMLDHIFTLNEAFGSSIKQFKDFFAHPPPRKQIKTNTTDNSNRAPRHPCHSTSRSLLCLRRHARCQKIKTVVFVRLCVWAERYSDGWVAGGQQEAVKAVQVQTSSAALGHEPHSARSSACRGSAPGPFISARSSEAEERFHHKVYAPSRKGFR